VIETEGDTHGVDVEAADGMDVWSSCRRYVRCVVVSLWAMLWSFFIIYFSSYGLSSFSII
jgi:hypothetical protein